MGALREVCSELGLCKSEREINREKDNALERERDRERHESATETERRRGWVNKGDEKDL